jgi:hypothetical protein
VKGSVHHLCLDDSRRASVTRNEFSTAAALHLKDCMLAIEQATCESAKCVVSVLGLALFDTWNGLTTPSRGPEQCLALRR